jgi:hypothetical protein
VSAARGSRTVAGTRRRLPGRTPDRQPPRRRPDRRSPYCVAVCVAIGASPLHPHSHSFVGIASLLRSFPERAGPIISFAGDAAPRSGSARLFMCSAPQLSTSESPSCGSPQFGCSACVAALGAKRADSPS